MTPTQLYQAVCDRIPMNAWVSKTFDWITSDVAWFTIVLVDGRIITKEISQTELDSIGKSPDELAVEIIEQAWKR